MVDEEPKLSYLTILSGLKLKGFTLPFFCSRIYHQQLEAPALGAFVSHQRFPPAKAGTGRAVRMVLVIP